MLTKILARPLTLLLNSIKPWMSPLPEWIFFRGEPIVNTFRFNEQLLKDGTLSFKSFSEYNEEWADFVFQHRDVTNVPPYKHFFDVVYGPIANDRVGLQIRNYRLGNIDKTMQASMER